MKEYVENVKEYVENMKEYEEICRCIGFGTLISTWALGLEKFRAPLSFSPWDLEKFQIFRLYMGLGKFHARASSGALGLGKILSLASYRLWDSEKFLASPWALGLEKILSSVSICLPGI